MRLTGRLRHVLRVAAVLGALVLMGSAPGLAATTTAPAAPTGPVPPPATVLIAGDIASCAWSGDRKTADIIKSRAGIVMTAGDNAYQTGSVAQYRDCYDPTWGQFKSRTRPVPGNHDWGTPGAAGYFGYFGSNAGPAGRGYYAFNAGTWRIYALTGDCWAVGGCKAGTPQYTWLEADLAAHPRACVMAAWHQPRFSSGPHGNSGAVVPLERLLYVNGAEIVVNGHDHHYERFGLARPNGNPDPARGIREFVVGTGGAPLYPFRTTLAPNSEVRNASTHGVLRLRLDAGAYAWKFLPVAGKTFTDEGSGTCH